MDFKLFGKEGAPTLLLIPGLGVTHEIFLPLIDILKGDFFIAAAGIDGFLLGQKSSFTSVDDQAEQIIRYVRENLNGRLNCAYGLSLGGKILSRLLERNEIVILLYLGFMTKVGPGTSPVASTQVVKSGGQVVKSRMPQFL